MRPISVSTWCGCARIPSRSRCCAARAPNGSGCRSASAASSRTGTPSCSRTKRVTAFTSSYSQAAVIFPYILVAPAYFADKIQLGGMMQTASAFSSVQQSLSFFVSIYRTLAEWQSVVARLDGFRGSDRRAPHRLTTAARRSMSCRRPAATAIDLEQLLVRLPDGTPLVAADGFSIQRQRAHPGHRPIRRRQVDLVPRHCRRLAVRQRRDRDPRQGHADDAAAAAVFSGRFAEGRDRLPCGSRTRSLRSWSRRCSDRGRPAATRPAAGGGSALEPDALARRTAAAWARARAVARAAISVPR